MADPIIVKIGTDPEQDRDYTDWNAFAADLDNPALYSSGDEVIAEAYNDGPFILNDDLVFSQGESIGLASVTITVAPGHRHNGTAGTGVVIDGGGFDLNKTWFHAEWLEVQNASSYGVNVTHGSGNVASRLSYLLCHHIGGDTRSDRRILAGASHQGAFHMTRCILYNLWQGGGGSRLAIGVSQGGTRQNYVRNVTIHYIRTTGTGRTAGMFGADRNTMVWENIVCTDVLDVNGDPAPCFELNPLAGARVWRYLASQDATAADADEGGIINIDPNTLYVNADPDAADLAIVDDGSGVATGGANLYGVINGVELAFTSTGEMRDLNAEDDDYWSIGAFQYVEEGGDPQPQNITAAHFVDADAFGEHALNLKVLAATAVNTHAFGSHTALLGLAAEHFANPPPTFGSHAIFFPLLGITASHFANAPPVFGSPSVHLGLEAGGHTNLSEFGVHSLLMNIAAAHLSAAEKLFGAHAVLLLVKAGNFVDSDAFGSHVLHQGDPPNFGDWFLLFDE